MRTAFIVKIEFEYNGTTLQKKVLQHALDMFTAAVYAKERFIETAFADGMTLKNVKVISTRPLT